MRCRILAVLMLMLVPATAPAQRQVDLRYGLTAPASDSPEQLDVLRPLRAPRSYWLVGALVTAVPAMVAFNVIVEPDDNTTFLGEVFGRVLGTALTGIVFAVPGAVIGGLFPKE